MKIKVKGEVITFQDLQSAISYLDGLRASDLKCTQLFLDGEHWQGQTGWIGWQPESDSKEAVSDWLRIFRGFTPKNVIGGIVRRARGAVFGKEPEWNNVAVGDTDVAIALTEEARELTAEEKQAKVYDEALTLWWSEKHVHEHLKTFITNKVAYGKAGIRLYIPPGFVEEVTPSNAAPKRIVKAKDFTEALSKIHVESLNYGTMQKVKDLNYAEDFTVVQLEKEKDSDITTIEVCYKDEDGKSCIRHVKSDNTEETISFDLGGHLTTFIEGKYTDALISPTVKAQQRAVNHAKTMEQFGMMNINFPETVFLNAEIESEKKVGENGKMVEVVKDVLRGFGRWIGLQGLIYGTANGGEAVSPVDVKWRKGESPELFAKVADNNSRDMHEEVGMLYVHLADSPYPSGESRLEAMTDYLILLVDSKTLGDKCGYWLLETVKALAFYLIGQTDEREKYTTVFSTQLTMGKMSAADKELMLKEVNAGLRDKASYIQVAEVSDDPTSTLKLVKADPPLALTAGEDATKPTTPTPPKAKTTTA